MKRSMTRLVLLSVLLASAAGAEEVQSTQTRPNRGMMSSGIVAFGVPYVASVIVAAESDHPGDHRLYIPVAGPWLDLGERHCPEGASSCSNEGLYKGLLITDGIVQGIGALEIVGAFLFPETVTVTGSSGRTQHAKAAPAPRIKIAPTFTGTGYGLAAVGAF